MFFNSMQYCIFFVAVFFVYYILPRKIRYIWLLASSYYFYMNWNAKYALLILGVTVVSYASALIIQNCQKLNTKKAHLAISVLLCFGLLIYFKYFNFLIDNVNRVFRHTGIERQFAALDILLPVGISFYTFQAVGYIIDVYRGVIDAEKNLFRYALFVSYFPQLVAGPIERSGNLMSQLKEPHPLTGDRLREGLIFILLGLWQKVLIADNIAAMINPIFDGYTSFGGTTIAVATMLFGIQIYCDFAGYTNIAIGSSKILGIDLMSNFSSPYLATSVPDFWRRWHISLTSWFRDYLYIPLGGNRKGTVRKYINTLIVFTASGAWHGAAWNYIFWGVLNGLMIIASNMKRKIAPEKSNLSRVDIMGKRIATFFLIDITWLFFRAPTLGTGFDMVKHAISNPGIRTFLQGTVLNAFGNMQTVFVVFAAVCLLLLIDAVKDKTGSFIAYLSNQKAIYRWSFYIIIVLMIIIFGAYGEGYEQTEFIYFQF